jgi:hypothetical protein
MQDMRLFIRHTHFTWPQPPSFCILVGMPAYLEDLKWDGKPCLLVFMHLLKPDALINQTIWYIISMDYHRRCTCGVKVNAQE